MQSGFALWVDSAIIPYVDKTCIVSVIAALSCTLRYTVKGDNPVKLNHDMKNIGIANYQL